MSSIFDVLYTSLPATSNHFQHKARSQIKLVIRQSPWNWGQAERRHRLTATPTLRLLLCDHLQVLANSCLLSLFACFLFEPVLGTKDRHKTLAAPASTPPARRDIWACTGPTDYPGQPLYALIKDLIGLQRQTLHKAWLVLVPRPGGTLTLAVAAQSCSC